MTVGYSSYNLSVQTTKIDITLAIYSTMMSNSSTSMAQNLSFGCVGQSPLLSSNFALTHGLLDSAAEQLMVHKDFQAAFDTCERGLVSLLNAEQADSRWVLVLRICSAFMTWSLLHCIIGLNRCPSDFQVWGVEGCTLHCGDSSNG